MAVLTEREFDNCLNEVFLRAAAKRFDAVSTDDLLPLSWKCRRQCAKMLANPRKFALRYHEPLAHKLQRWTVAAVLLLVLCGYTVLFVPQVRVWAINILSAWHEEYLEYSFTYKGTKVELTLPEIEVTYMTQGYVLNDYQNPFGFSANFDYVNDENQIVNIYVVANDNLNMYIDNEHRVIKDVVLDNYLEAKLLEATDDNWPSDLTWTSADGKIVFSIVGHLTKEEMLKIANGIICK